MIDIRATRSPVIPAKAGIQYAAASRFYHWRSGILGARSSRAMTLCARVVICPSGSLSYGDKSLLAMTLANIVARMEPTGRREAPPDDRLREIRDSRDTGPGLRFAPSGLQRRDLPVGLFRVQRVGWVEPTGRANARPMINS